MWEDIQTEEHGESTRPNDSQTEIRRRTKNVLEGTTPLKNVS